MTSPEPRAYPYLPAMIKRKLFVFRRQPDANGRFPRGLPTFRALRADQGGPGCQEAAGGEGEQGGGRHGASRALQPPQPGRAAQSDA